VRKRVRDILVNERVKGLTFLPALVKIG